MDYQELAIDRIHQLAEQAFVLERQGYAKEAEILLEEAEMQAEDLREIYNYA